MNNKFDYNYSAPSAEEKKEIESIRKSQVYFMQLFIIILKQIMGLVKFIRHHLQYF